MGKLTVYFYNHISKKGYFCSHENITSYGIPLLANKIVHPSLSKDMKVPMQIQRGKCYSLMLLSKNQLYKYQNQINEVPTTNKWDDIEIFFKYISARHFTNVYNLLLRFRNGRIVICRCQGVSWAIMTSCFESFL